MIERNFSDCKLVEIFTHHAGSITIIITQLFIIYLLSQQLWDQLQTLHSARVSNYIVELYNIDKGKLQAR
jgi:hypothetical protein